MLRGILRGDKVSYSLCLREVEFTVEEGALGVFSWCCRLTSFLNQERADGLENIRRAVGADLYAILACIGMWSAEEGEKYLIDNGIRVYYRSVMERISWGINK
jgi:hypothetical protein